MAAILATAIIILILNIPSLILIIMGIVLIVDKKPIGRLSSKQLRVIGMVLIILAVVLAAHVILTGNGIQ
jgi:uncharacterized protein YjeT (DUF2065 family)